jgi:signal transduction histidine kinase
MVVDEQDPLGHLPLIGRCPAADKRDVDHLRSQSYRSWLVGEIVLISLLASGTCLFALSESLQSAYELPEARLVLDTAVAVVAGIVFVLASVRFLVDGRTLDLLLAAGFWSIALGTAVFGIAPVLGGSSLHPAAAWALVGARLLGAALIAVAPWADGRLSARRPALLAVGVGVVVILASAGFGLRTPDWGDVTATGVVVEGNSVVAAAGILACLWLCALIGFALRYRRYGRDLDSWLCLSATLALFADLHLVLTPVVSSDFVLQGDFLRVIAYATLLVGVWRAIADAEFGRAVADERARVAREIHDGLAQYLFAISTQVNMLETGAPLEQVLPRLKRASTAAQQEARFAVLALSSAGGSARFDSALRRYVEVLTSDGELDVELDVDRQVRLAPDEQIEVFRIVQEGLGNARRHADASHVAVAISHRAGRRVVSVRDDGRGFDEEQETFGQGLQNMKVRAEAIDGELSLTTMPGRGTAIEVVLRAT